MRAAEIVGHKIKVRRVELKMSQTDLAKVLNISQGHMSGIEQAKYKLSVDVLEAIAKALRCPITDLFDKKAEKAA